jgi:hypothetical protein
MYDLTSTATTLEELRAEIAEMARYYATQQRLGGNIGRTTKLSRAQHEYASQALEVLANHIETITLDRRTK